MVKPDFWDDEKLSKLSRDARLTFIGIWTHADDVGICKGNLKWLKNNIFPYDEIKSEIFEKWIDELSRLKVIMPYTASGEKYIHIKNFLKHQTINKPTPSKSPQPSETLVNEYYGSSAVALPPEEKLSKVKGSGDHLFKNSEYSNDYGLFKEKFLANENYIKYDVNYYYEAVKNWSEGKGAMKKDWIAVARNFALSDKFPKLSENKPANIITIA